WDAPAYPEDGTAGEQAPALPSLQVDYGPLAGHLEQFTESPQVLMDRYNARLKADPQDAGAYHQRGHLLIHLNRLQEGIDDLTRAIRILPNDGHLLSARGQAYLALRQDDAAIEDLAASLTRAPAQPVVRDLLAQCCNNRAWDLATWPGGARNLSRALLLGGRAVELDPDRSMFLNTLGVVLYRTGKFNEATEILHHSLRASRGRFDGFDLFFLAMAHHRQGRRAEARVC